MKMPLIYQRILEMVQNEETDRSNAMSSKLARDFRLSKSDAKGILKELDQTGKLKLGNKGKLTLTPDGKD